MEKPPYRVNPKRDARLNWFLSTIKEAVRAINVLLSADFDPAVVPAIVKGSINLQIWGVTEANGKYVGVQHWSLAAMEQWHKNRIDGKGANNDLRHEHVHPRAQLLRRIVDEEEDVDVVAKDIFACVVTKEENKQLNKVDKNKQGWERYCALKIDVQKYDSDKQDWVDFIKDGEFV